MDTIRLSQYSDTALLLLRIGVGLIFIISGWNKLIDIASVEGFFGNIGIPAAGLMAWVVAIVEFVGGILVLGGFYMRVPALLLACVMLVAILTTKLGGEWNPVRLDLMLLLTNLALFILGPGRISVEGLLE